MEMLTIKDFTKIHIKGPTNPYYYSYKENEIEICLAPSSNGFDVGLYTRESMPISLLEESTNIKQGDYLDRSVALVKAVEIANNLYQQYQHERNQK